MNYEIRRVEVPFNISAIVEYEAENLCKLIKAVPKDKDTLELVILERWGSEKQPGCKHKVVIMEEGVPFQVMLPYEPILSRRGEFKFKNKDITKTYYLFQI